MLELNEGHIVTVASSLGLFTTAGVEVCVLYLRFLVLIETFCFVQISFSLNCVSSQDYCASKFGAIGFHESLSHELKAANKDGIKMTLVCPFLVDTGMFKGCEIRLVSI